MRMGWAAGGGSGVGCQHTAGYEVAQHVRYRRVASRRVAIRRGELRRTAGATRGKGVASRKLARVYGQQMVWRGWVG